MCNALASAPARARGGAAAFPFSETDQQIPPLTEGRCPSGHSGLALLEDVALQPNEGVKTTKPVIMLRILCISLLGASLPRPTQRTQSQRWFATSHYNKSYCECDVANLYDWGLLFVSRGGGDPHPSPIIQTLSKACALRSKQPCYEEDA